MTSRLPDESVATVSLVDGLLSVGVEGQLRMPLVPTREGFFAQAADAELVFVEDEDGHVTGGDHRLPAPL